MPPTVGRSRAIEPGSTACLTRSGVAGVGRPAAASVNQWQGAIDLDLSDGLE